MIWPSPYSSQWIRIISCRWRKLPSYSEGKQEAFPKSMVELHTFKVQAVISTELCASSILMWKGDWEIWKKPKECSKPFPLWVEITLNAEAPGKVVSQITPRLKTSWILGFSHFISLKNCNVYLVSLRVGMCLLSQRFLFCKSNWEISCVPKASPVQVLCCSPPSHDEESSCWRTGAACHSIACGTNDFSWNPFCGAVI